MRHKFQIPSSKIQTNLKFQLPKFQVDFEHWNLFVIWNLIFGILLAAFYPLNTFAVDILPPNDPLYQEHQKFYLEQVRVPEAWETTIGSPNIIIAVIDSGVDIDHPDLIDNIWSNPSEIPGNGIDDDNNGYVDDLHGWDFVDNVSDPHPKVDKTYDLVGTNHGTAIASIIAAPTNNNQGLAGVCEQCKIMALRTLDSFGFIRIDSLVKAIRYAIKNKAQIISFSFISESDDKILSDAISEARQAGVLLIASAGNNAMHNTSLGGDLAVNPVYPACTDGGIGNNWMLGVGSVGKDNRKSSFSSYGVVCVDIMAPGEDIAVAQFYEPNKGEDFTHKYAFDWDGTSLSAPIVAGVAGLMKSVNSRLTNDQIIEIIRSTGKNIDTYNSGYESELGGGLLNAEAAVKLALATTGLAVDLLVVPDKSIIDKPIIVKPLIVVKNILFTSGSGRAAKIALTDKSGKIKNEILVFPESFRAGVSFARGDVNNDGLDEIVVVPGKGGGPQVRIFSLSGELITQFFVYNKDYRQGVNLALADINHDHADDIITAAFGKNESLVNIIFTNGEKQQSFKIKTIGADGPINLSTADIDADGEIEIVAGAPIGALPEIQIFDTIGNKKRSWLAFPKSFRGGVKVALADVDRDDYMEIVAVAANKSDPQIRIFSAFGKLKYQFFAFGRQSRFGLSVAVGNVDDDSQMEIIVGTGAGARGAISIFSKFGAEFSQEKTFNVFENKFKGGIIVGI